MMIDLTIASFVLSSLSLLGVYTFYIERPIIKIKSINPGMNGVGSPDGKWQHYNSGIEVEVRNKGKRDAQNCYGLVTFKKLDPLTLYSVEEGSDLHNTKKFNFLAGETKTLSSSWGFSKTNSAEPIKYYKYDFINKAPPIEVVIFYGEKTVRKKLKEEDLDRLIRQSEEQDYIYS